MRVSDRRPLMLRAGVLRWGVSRRDRRVRLAWGALAQVFADGAAVPVLLDHDPDLELGAVRPGGAGPHRLWANDRGLWLALALEPGPVADRLERALRRGRLTGCSIGLGEIEASRDDLLPDGRGCNTILAASIREISLLVAPSRPAYPAPGGVQVWRGAGHNIGWRPNPARERAILGAVAA